jgi:radial spoke head protein 1
LASTKERETKQVDQVLKILYVTSLLGQRHGYGKALLPNGDIFEGSYKNGLRYGEGKYIFRRDDRSGAIEEILPHAKYVGFYKRNMRNGNGSFWYPDG